MLRRLSVGRGGHTKHDSACWIHLDLSPSSSRGSRSSTDESHVSLYAAVFFHGANNKPAWVSNGCSWLLVDDSLTFSNLKKCQWYVQITLLSLQSTRS